MQPKFHSTPAVGSLLVAAALLLSCQKTLTPIEKPATEANPLTESVSVAISPELQGRALAANCFQCHGTNGYASELKIAGINATALMSKFTEMRARGARDNIMNLHAFAYTNEEITLIGNFFSKQ